MLQEKRTSFVYQRKKIAVLASNENKVYAYVDYEESRRERQFMPKAKVKIVKDTLGTESIEEEGIAETRKVTKEITKTKYHTVKRGDNLGDIANKYNVAIADVKKWNRLKSNNVKSGAKLKIIYDDKILVTEKIKKSRSEVEPKTEEKAIAAVAKKDTKIKNEAIKEHIVEQGQTLTAIAKMHKMYVADIKKYNNLKDSNVKVGDKLKLQPTTESEVENKETLVASTDTGETVHVVEKGQNIFQIAKLNKVSVNDIMNWNNMTTTSINVGDKLKIEKIQEVIVEAPKKKNSKFEEQKLYIVQKGDSLFKISQKHNITVTELKKKNNIKENDLQPGMKLKI